MRKDKLYEQLNNNQMDLLRNAAECGIIDMDSVLDTYMANKRNQVKKLHPYSITPPAQDGGRWQTWYKDESGKRKNIKAPTEEELFIFYKTIMRLNEERSLILISNRDLPMWYEMRADRHVIETLLSRLSHDSQIIYL